MDESVIMMIRNIRFITQYIKNIIACIFAVKGMNISYKKYFITNDNHDAVWLIRYPKLCIFSEGLNLPLIRQFNPVIL